MFAEINKIEIRKINYRNTQNATKQITNSQADEDKYSKCALQSFRLKQTNQRTKIYKMKYAEHLSRVLSILERLTVDT
ncbi:hypothetical protein D0T87_20935 [Bacteroides sp. 51]|nr:hypothetical protein [Bacteroides sp. 51]